MSNLIYGNIIGEFNQATNAQIKSLMTNFCIDNSLGIHFLPLFLSPNNTKYIGFQISDDFDVCYCERFMPPIIYTYDGTPMLDTFYKDLDKLKELICKIFSFNFIEKIELKFSYIEVDEEEYEICSTNIDEVERIILSKYLSSISVPVIKVIINK